MNFTVRASALTEILRKAVRAISKQPVLPAARFIKLYAGPGWIETTGTNTNLFIGAKCPAQTLVGGCCLIDPSLLKIASSAGEATLEFTVEKGILVMGGYGEAALTIHDAEDFPIAPSIEEGTTLVLDEREIAALGVSVGEDFAVPHQAAIHLNGRFCGTTVQGFWMTVVQLEEEYEPLMIPYRHLNKAVKACGEATITLTENSAHVQGENVWATFQLFDGSSISVSRFATLEPVATMEVAYEDIIEVLNLADFYSMGSCRLEIEEDELLIESGGSELGFYRKSIPAVIEGASLSGLYSAKRLLMALKNIRSGHIELLSQRSEGFYTLRLVKDNVSHFIAPMARKGNP